MNLRILSTRIAVDTDGERFARQLEFDEGLTLIRADNNMGKTTLLTTILYALGWEGMLGASRTPPFKPATVSEIEGPGGSRHRVLASSVSTEMEGAEMVPLTMERAISSEIQSTNLVRTWRGRGLTDPEEVTKGSDYFVREGGAAAREAGYQNFLASFIGWTMPKVSRWSGEPVPLYMEVIAPLLFIEQTRGWSRIAAMVPRYLQIRDPERRAVEFLLSLDSLTRSREYDALLAEREEERAGWKGEVQSFIARSEESGARISSLPEKATVSWPPDIPVSLELLDGNEWQNLTSALSDLRRQVSNLEGEPPPIESVAEEHASELAKAEAELSEIFALLGAGAREIREQSAELQEVNVRITALEEDRARYVDALKLRNLGSKESLEIDDGHCPTCEQPLPATLHGANLGTALSLDENKSLIDEELKTFKAVREDASHVLAASKQRHGALEAQVNDARRAVRTLRGALTQPSQERSEATIAKRIRLLDRIEDLEGLEAALLSLEQNLGERSERYRRILAAMDGLGIRGAATDADGEKLEAFEMLLREQLEEYGFSSVPPLDIELARDSYLPLYQEQPLRETKISASDNVRLVWAYVVGLLEMARTFETNHPGLLVLDEPGQQEVKPESLEALLHRLARASAHEQQVIVASSKKPDVIRSLLEGTDASLRQIDGYVLQSERPNNPEQ